MKKIIFLLFILFSFTIYSQEKKCSNYKIGKFTYTNPSYSNWKVTRSETEQIEIDEVNKIKLIASISWLSDCEYVLTYISFNDTKEHPIIGQKINVKITKIGNDSILCKSEGLGTKLELEMVFEK